MYVVWLVAAAAAINVCVCVEHQQPSSRGGSLFLSFMFIFTSFEKKNMITFVYMRYYLGLRRNTPQNCATYLSMIFVLKHVHITVSLVQFRKGVCFSCILIDCVSESA